MRASVILLSGVLVVGLMAGGCRNGGGGSGSDAGVADAGNGGTGGHGDGGTPGPDGGGAAPACDVARQQGCDAGALCLRGVLENGGQGNRCFPGECDPVARNCPAGNKCTYVRQGSVTLRRCVPDGTVAEGGACTSTATPEGDFYDTCQAGLYCTDHAEPDGGTAFTCERFCHASEQCTAPRDCTEVLRFMGSDELPRVCGEAVSACDLLAQGCASPLGCYPSPESGPVCVTAGTVEDGAACTYSNDCRPGSACVTEGTGRACRGLCRSPSGEPGCSSGHCEPLRDFAGVGACVP
ncbi:hypothetical protein ATI61_117138 [Archangium gephyra]|uniref:Lipoprotein n=1 Tax=Archangium gephyra TaxID=48 RepID=A0ABX9JNX6_9BACT|nr:hypothetical protein [Archangium gephyra]REG23293.1 hypothetical protein ATI61_117138 [Archangium gephyra]